LNEWNLYQNLMDQQQSFACFAGSEIKLASVIREFGRVESVNKEKKVLCIDRKGIIGQWGNTGIITGNFATGQTKIMYSRGSAEEFNKIIDKYKKNNSFDTLILNSIPITFHPLVNSSFLHSFPLLRKNFSRRVIAFPSSISNLDDLFHHPHLLVYCSLLGIQHFIYFKQPGRWIIYENIPEFYSKFVEKQNQTEQWEFQLRGQMRSLIEKDQKKWILKEIFQRTGRRISMNNVK
jgi:hypothetical protein